MATTRKPAVVLNVVDDDLPPEQPSTSGRINRDVRPGSPPMLVRRSSEGPSGTNRGLSVSSQTLQFFFSHWEKLLLLFFIIGLCVLISFKGFSVFGDILDWLQQHNNAFGWVCFTLLYATNVTLFLPGIVMILGAGFIYKFWRGLAAVWVGGTIGQALAFLLGRYLLRDWIVTVGKGKWKRWEIVDKAIELDGWKLVLLLRLSPLVPYNLLNITMAMTKINFWQFAFVSSAAIVPECSLMVYFGSLAKNMRDVVTGQAGPTGRITWILGGVSVATCLGTAAWATVVAKRAMKRAELHMRLAATERERDKEHGLAAARRAVSGSVAGTVAALKSSVAPFGVPLASFAMAARQGQPPAKGKDRHTQ